jgi:hypothetical protein
MAELNAERYTRQSPNKKIDLTAYFDSLDLGVDAIDDWDEFQKAWAEAEIRNQASGLRRSQEE